MNINTALQVERQRRMERESMYMGPTVLSGVIDIRSGEFRGRVNFPQHFNGEPITTFGYKAAPGVPLPANNYPEWNIYVLRYVVKENPNNVTGVVVGFDFAGYLTSDKPQSGQIGWIAVGEAFVGI